MNSVPESTELFQTIPIPELEVGNILVNLGLVLEISQENEEVSIVIERMGERQVWRFNKKENLTIKRQL